MQLYLSLKRGLDRKVIKSAILGDSIEVVLEEINVQGVVLLDGHML